MRLLKTGPFVTGEPVTLELHDFPGQRERYAVLSHTWGASKDEITYADLVAICDNDIRRRYGYLSVDLKSEAAQFLKRKPGWAKLAFALEQADEDGKGWLWLDSACIDKSSSAIIADSINSMWEWYQGSAICYTYLADVPLEEWRTMQGNHNLQTRWATRGWTLLELLAPGHVVFYSSEWSRLGDKHELSPLLAGATKIEAGIIDGSRPLEDECIAKRMSWASHRETTLPEDVAYSLMGLFGINMPVLYGEGQKAFLRLQQEIIKVSDDQSIFAWKDPSVGDRPHGLLADSPKAFAHAGDYRTYGFEAQSPFEMSNRGIRVSLHLTPDRLSNAIASLQCPHPASRGGFLGIYLKKLPTGDDQYARVHCNKLSFLETRGDLRQIFVRQFVSSNAFLLPLDEIQTNGLPSTASQSSATSPISPIAGPSYEPLSRPNGLHMNGVSTPPPERSSKRLSQWNGVMPTHIFHLSKVRTWGNYKIMDVQFLPPKVFLEKYRLHTELERPDNVAEQFPVSFKMSKEDHRITAAILFGREDDNKRVAILLGSGMDCEPGFDIVECDDLEALKTYKKPFDPMAFGTMAFGKHHRVTVRAEEMVRSSVKVYMLEIGVGGMEKMMKREPLTRQDSQRSSISKLSWVVQKVSRRHSVISQ